MPPTVSLSAVLDAMEMASDSLRSYVDPESGSVVTISEEEESLLDRDELPPDLPEWQQDALSELRKLDLDRLLPLPDRFEIHEWEIMRRFAEARSPEEHREGLLDAIHGSGAFRSFRRELERLGLREAWYEYRHAELERIAKDWLESHGLEWR